MAQTGPRRDATARAPVGGGLTEMFARQRQSSQEASKRAVSVTCVTPCGGPVKSLGVPVPRRRGRRQIFRKRQKMTRRFRPAESRDAFRGSNAADDDLEVEMMCTRTTTLGSQVAAVRPAVPPVLGNGRVRGSARRQPGDGSRDPRTSGWSVGPPAAAPGGGRVPGGNDHRPAVDVAVRAAAPVGETASVSHSADEALAVSGERDQAAPAGSAACFEAGQPGRGGLRTGRWRCLAR